MSSNPRAKPSIPGFFHEEPLVRQVVLVAEEAPREAVYGDLPGGLHPGVAEVLTREGIERVFSHQAHAAEAALSGRDVAVATGTNSGKSLCYNLPALHLALSEPAARMLYLFPTKALAQDQFQRLARLLPASARPAVYDGDTPHSQRAMIRKSAQAVLTNPDMLHVGILPNHEGWGRFLKSLRLIVVDEMHVYRGIFGSNVAMVLRRLLRLCEAVRSRPQIIGCSATIGNPKDLFERLTGREPIVVDEDGSPRARRTFVLVNPAAPEEAQALTGNAATAEMMARLVEHGHRTLAFSRARVSAELVLKYVRNRLGQLGHPAESVEGYRAGYTPAERRELEKGLHEGRLMGLSSTNALELGVDIGGLDAVLMNGFPGSIASFLQQAGRAGRGMREGLAVYVAREDPLEQYLLRNPAQLLESRSESVALNPENPHVLRAHLRCAAHERPLAPSEMAAFGETALDVAEQMDRGGELAFRAGMFVYPSFESPALQVNIRGAGGEMVRLILDGQEVGTMEYWRALEQGHAGAVYLHRGQSFLVERLDLDQRIAFLSRQEVPYHTQPIVESSIDVQVEIATKGSCGLRGVEVSKSVTGFRRISDRGMPMDIEPLEMPVQTFQTLAVQFQFPGFGADADPEEWVHGVHAAEHALLAVAPLFAGCDRGDLGSSWHAYHPLTSSPLVFVYDGTPGGVGLAERLFHLREEWLDAALRLVEGCKCDSGCPACLLSSRCEVGNEHLSKRGASALLRVLTV